jgi:hypothetical protein
LPIFIVLLLIGLLIVLLVIGIVAHVRLRCRIKRVSFENYEIRQETVKSVARESYVAKGPKWHSERVGNYTLFFESGKSWRIPKDNYLWSEERPMSDFAGFQSAHRGDTFLAVVKKDTEDVVVAYHTTVFEYLSR